MADLTLPSTPSTREKSPALPSESIPKPTTSSTIHVINVNQRRKRRLADLSQEEINEIIALRGKLPQAVIGKKFGIEQTDVSQIQRLQKGRFNRNDDKRRVKDIEVVLPIVCGSISFWLGKKADEFHSHKWTVYLRAANNEDLGDVVKRVIFTLHPSFNNPIRIVEAPPFELSETGWGEFEIGITLWLHGDASEKPVELFHGLKLYPEEDAGPPTTKKPVVVESYDELVFTEPLDTFFQRVRNNPAIHLYGSSAALAAAALAPQAEVKDTQDKRETGDTKNHPLVQWFGQFSDADELSKLSVARQQVAAQVARLEQEYSTVELECQRLRGATAT